MEVREFIMTTDFNGFGLPPKILQSLARMQFTTPTPIQAQAIPLALTGRDILGSAQTGPGRRFAAPNTRLPIDAAEANLKRAIILAFLREGLFKWVFQPPLRGNGKARGQAL